MNGWAIAYLCIMSCRFATSLVKHGAKREDVNVFRTLFILSVDAIILWQAGLFS